MSSATVGSIWRRGRRDRLQRREQLLRIVLDRGDAVLGEEVGEEPHHHLAVLQHVGDAGGRAGIVLEDVEVVLVGPHDVDAGDVDVDVVGQLQPGHLGPVVGVAVDEVGGDDAGAQDLGRPVDVGEEDVERPHPLLEAAGKALPLGAGQDARNDVEGDDALFGLVLAVDGEGDADAAEEQLGLGRRWARLSGAVESSQRLRKA